MVIPEYFIPGFIATLLLFACTGCDFTGDEQRLAEPAQAILTVTVIDSEDFAPVPGIEIEVGAIFEREDEPRTIGSFVTDEEGQIDGVIAFGREEITINTFIFVLVTDETTQIVEKSVNLELRLQEPFDSVNLSVEFDV